MITDIGPRPVELGGKTFMLYMLSAAGFASVVETILKNNPPKKSMDHLMAYFDKLSPEMQRAGLECSLKLDHEEEQRDRFAPPKLSAAAFLDPEVVGLTFYMMGSKQHPDLDINWVKDQIKKETALVVWAKINVAFPEITKGKKDQGSPDSSSSGQASTGPESVAT